MACPICLSAFTEPVVASDGFSYDLTCLMAAWNSKGPTYSPMTKEPLARFVVPNYFACDTLSLDNRAALKARAVAFSCPLSSFNESEHAFLNVCRSEVALLTSRATIFTAGAFCNYVGFLQHTRRVRTLSKPAAEELARLVNGGMERVLPIQPTRLSDYAEDGTYHDREVYARLLDGLEKRYQLADLIDLASSSRPLCNEYSRLSDVVTHAQEWAHRPRGALSVRFRTAWFRRMGVRSLERECKRRAIEGVDVTDPVQRAHAVLVLAHRHD